MLSWHSADLPLLNTELVVSLRWWGYQQPPVHLTRSRVMDCVVVCCWHCSRPEVVSARHSLFSLCFHLICEWVICEMGHWHHLLMTTAKNSSSNLFPALSSLLGSSNGSVSGEDALWQVTWPGVGPNVGGYGQNTPNTSSKCVFCVCHAVSGNMSLVFL